MEDLFAFGGQISPLNAEGDLIKRADKYEAALIDSVFSFANVSSS